MTQTAIFPGARRCPNQEESLEFQPKQRRYRESRSDCCIRRAIDGYLCQMFIYDCKSRHYISGRYRLERQEDYLTRLGCPRVPLSNNATFFLS